MKVLSWATLIGKKVIYGVFGTALIAFNTAAAFRDGINSQLSQCTVNKIFLSISNYSNIENR